MKQIKKNYLKFFCGLLISSCMAQRGDQQLGTLQGQTGEYTGNCMPAPNTPPCKAKPISALVIISKLTRDYNPDLVIDSIRSNEKGLFQVMLPKGAYSLFIKDGGSYVCTGVSCPDQCYCTPIEIDTDSTTQIEINLDHATW